METVHAPAKDVPGMFYRVKVWRPRRPVHTSDVVVLENICDNPCTMWTGVVVHEDEVRACLLCPWDDDRCDNFISVPYTRHGAPSDDNKISSPSNLNASPDHQTATSITIMFSNRTVGVSFVTVSPHTGPPIVEVQTEPRLICEENIAPTIDPPVTALISPNQPLLSVMWRQWNALCWSSGPQTFSMESVPHRLCGDSVSCNPLEVILERSGCGEPVSPSKGGQVAVLSRSRHRWTTCAWSLGHQSSLAVTCHCSGDDATVDIKVIGNSTLSLTPLHHSNNLSNLKWC